MRQKKPSTAVAGFALEGAVQQDFCSSSGRNAPADDRLTVDGVRDLESVHLDPLHSTGEVIGVEDLSTLAEHSIVGMSSMHAGNTVSVPPPDGAPGSESEATHGVGLHSTPDMDLGSQKDLTRDAKGSDGYPLTPRTWKTVK